MTFERWPHQIYAVETAISKMEAGIKSFVVTSPTGGGKSTIMMDLCLYAIEHGWQVVVFSNRKLLTSQLARGLNAAGIHIGMIAADFESWTDPNAPVQICSVPTIAARVVRKRKLAMQRAATEEEAHRDHKLFPAQLILIDEAHAQSGGRTVEIIDEYRAKFNAIVVGITATPLGISHIYDELIIAGKTSSLRECGALVPAYCYEPMVMDMSKVYKSKHELPSQAEMEKATKMIWTQHLVGSIFDHWKKLNPEEKPSLGFAPGVGESLGMAQLFWSRGVGAAHISGSGLYMNGREYKSTNQEDRDEIFARLKDGTIKALWNRFVLREAIDLPFLECLILACPIASLLSLIQIVGRGLRACAETGKSSCTMIDHCGNFRLHGSPNMDRDNQWRTYFHEEEEKITKDRLNRLRDPDDSEPEPITCPQCGAMRRTGTKCERCGFEHSQSVRSIIQEDGTLVATEAAFMPKRKTKIFNNTARLWEQCYWRLKNSKKRDFSFGQVRALFIHENHYCPPDGLPLMPKYKDDWSRKLGAVSSDRLVPKSGQ